jgi:hypothetical protein
MTAGSAAGRLEGVGRILGGVRSLMLSVRSGGNFHRKPTPVVEAQEPRQPVADSSPRQLETDPAEVGVDFLASLLDLGTYARTHNDQVLLGHLRRLRVALEHWTATTELEGSLQMSADLDEYASEVIAAFRRMVNLGVERRDPELLTRLGRLQASWISWASSAQAVPA